MPENGALSVAGSALLLEEAVELVRGAGGRPTNGELFFGTTAAAAASINGLTGVEGASEGRVGLWPARPGRGIGRLPILKIAGSTKFCCAGFAAVGVVCAEVL